ncbi:hypothetical protein TNCV_2338801 [Trichonephila clavipes]|nr:hypothetical protein TNCV_2338801 [Trichonephila clavipes]
MAKNLHVGLMWKYGESDVLIRYLHPHQLNAIQNYVVRCYHSTEHSLTCKTPYFFFTKSAFGQRCRMYNPPIDFMQLVVICME